MAPPAPCRKLCRMSGTGRLARSVCRTRAGFRGDQAEWLANSTFLLCRKNRKPEDTSSGFAIWLRRCGDLLRSELIVHAGAEEIRVKCDVVGDRHAVAIEPAIEAAEIDIKIFDLGRPVERERGFESGADRPAGIVAAGRCEARDRGLDIAECGAAGDVRHEQIRGITEAAAHRGEPGIARRAAGRTQIIGRAADARPIDVTFDTGDDLAELIIVAGSAADDPAAHVAAGRIPVRTAEPAAAVDADVKSGPIVDG